MKARTIAEKGKEGKKDEGRIKQGKCRRRRGRRKN
jgi:hypothetical protein